MKTLRNLLFVAVLALIFAPKSFALVCETSQALGGPEACYTKVTVSSQETTLVSTGTALVYELDATTPKQGSYQVKVSTASTNNVWVAGFAQGPIKSGDSAMVLVRGYGLVRTTGGIASGDELFVVASGNVAAPGIVIRSSEPVAVALQTSSSNGSATRAAFVRVV